MASPLNIYLSGSTPVHTLDARAKVLLLLVYSVAAFCVSTWWGLAVLCVPLVFAIAAARIPFSRMLPLGVPLLFLSVIIWVCNAFVLDVNAETAGGFAGVSAGFAEGMEDIALVGSFGFSPQGSMRTLYYLVRIFLVLYASFVVTFTTTSDGLTNAFGSLLHPLRVVHFPVDDTATVLALALRFIPQIYQNLVGIQRAQMSRGAQFDEGGPWVRLKSYVNIMIPLFVGMFRQGSRMAEAMDARCYGATARTSLNAKRFGGRSACILVTGCCLFSAVAVLL